MMSKAERERLDGVVRELRKHSEDYAKDATNYDFTASYRSRCTGTSAALEYSADLLAAALKEMEVESGN